MGFRVWGVRCQNQFSSSSKLGSTAASNYWLDNSLCVVGTHPPFSSFFIFHSHQPFSFCENKPLQVSSKTFHLPQICHLPGVGGVGWAQLWGYLLCLFWRPKKDHLANLTERVGGGQCPYKTVIIAAYKSFSTNADSSGWWWWWKPPFQGLISSRPWLKWKSFNENWVSNFFSESGFCWISQLQFPTSNCTRGSMLQAFAFWEKYFSLQSENFSENYFQIFLDIEE